MSTYDYICDFAETLLITIPGTTHRLPTHRLEVFVKVPTIHHVLIPYFLPWWYTIHSITRDVTIYLFSNRHSGVVILALPEPMPPPSADASARTLDIG